MPVTDLTTDPESLTMTLTAEFEVPVERLWQAFTDPRQLEQFWGPPGWPATFTGFEFEVGGFARYHMTGPTGHVISSAWEFLTIDEPFRFEVLDSFVDDGTASESFPTMRATFEFAATPSGSRLTNTTHFASADDLAQTVDMGAVEAAPLAFNQLDRVLAGLRAFAEGKGTRVELLDDVRARITRLVEGPIDLVWRAHVEPDLIRRWLLGPAGWRMSVCRVEAWVGGTFEYEWEPEPGTEGQRFGFDGETLLIDPPRRWVTTERMVRTDFPATTNDLSLHSADGATLVTLLITYPDQRTRDMVLATGMADGMEASFLRLEALLAPL
ncbi:MAG: SRPBCC domain-containing protein [Actinobacteria bacterium]|nr:SRPBCC domain-containing protein [Actinomycetota bacterium]